MKSISQKGLMTACSVAALLALGACGERDTAAEQRLGSAADRTEQRAESAADRAEKRSEQAANEVRQESREATTAMGAGTSATGPIDDAQIVTKINMSLAADKDLSATKIDVDSKGGVVTLSGTVPNTAAKERASDIAKNTKDVKSVENQLTVSAG